MVSKKTWIMKKIISILLLVLSMNLYSQDYIPLAREGQHWIIMVYDYQDTVLVYLWEYYMTGDTIINDFEYKTVYKRNLDKSNWYHPPFIGEEDYYPVGAIRDDISDRKAYAVLFKNSISTFCPVNEDYLLYDFSLSLNDTVDFCSFLGWDDPNLIIQIYDDIRYDQNTIVFSTYTHEYLEGIGSPFGLFEDIKINFKKDRFPSNPQLIYYCPTNDCDVLLDIDKPTTIKQFKTYPNPISRMTQTHLTFELPPITNETTIQITDIFGKTIVELPLIKGQTQLVWNCSTSATGVYFYQTEIAGVVYRGKIVVN